MYKRGYSCCWTIASACVGSGSHCSLLEDSRRKYRFVYTNNMAFCDIYYMRRGASLVCLLRQFWHLFKPLPSPMRACRGHRSERPFDPTSCRPFVNNITHSVRPKVAVPSGQSANGCALCSLPKRALLFQFVPSIRNINRNPEAEPKQQAISLLRFLAFFTVRIWNACGNTRCDRVGFIEVYRTKAL